ncbi:uncharacterized protein LOC127041341 isoform X2 [Gopherus flavomarginatus]|nr:uncharacterized protein LOC127041341 isoform X2 [Gopherus flavomarginatus]
MESSPEVRWKVIKSSDSVNPVDARQELPDWDKSNRLCRNLPCVSDCAVTPSPPQASGAFGAERSQELRRNPGNSTVTRWIRLNRFQTSRRLLPSKQEWLFSSKIRKREGENLKEIPPGAHIHEPEYSLSPQRETWRRRLVEAKPQRSLRFPWPLAPLLPG